MTSQITPDGLSPASRARSTAASVWPVRSSTPPALAFSGKMWPGCTRSAGRALGSMATWIVCARSCAEMPGGDALARLDRDGERGLEGRLVLRRHQVEAQLVAAVGRERQADQAAPVLGHEVDRLGRGELGREREVALVLAILGVADHDHPAVADVLDRLLDGAEGSSWLTRTPSRAFSTYFASTSTSRFTRPPGLGGAERRALQRLRDQRHREARVVHLDDGKRHAVHGDRALLDDVAQQLRGRGHADHAGEAGLASPLHLPHPVHVALDDVAAEPVAGPQRQLEVHLVARGERAQRAALERLRHQVGGERRRRPDRAR